MPAVTDSTYFIGQGKVRLATRIGGGGALNSGYAFVGDVSDLQIDHAQKFVDIEENVTGFGGSALHASISIPVNMKMTMTQWSMANIQRAVYGSWGGMGAGGTVTSEALTLYNGQRAYLANIGVSAETIKVGTNPLVAGTDYILDTKFGALDILPGSTNVPVGAGVAATANYTWAANNGKVEALTASAQEVSLMFEGLNVAVPDGSGSFAAVKVHLLRVSLSISKMLSLLSRKEGSIEIDGMVLQDPTVTTTGLSQYYTIVKA